jgi:hypothetical protein
MMNPYVPPYQFGLPKELTWLTQAMGMAAPGRVYPYGRVSSVRAYSSGIIDRVSLANGLQAARFRKEANPAVRMQRAYREAQARLSIPGPEGTFLTYGPDRLLRAEGPFQGSRIDVVV